jgi:hypothetical protein
MTDSSISAHPNIFKDDRRGHPSWTIVTASLVSSGQKLKVSLRIKGILTEIASTARFVI